METGGLNITGTFGTGDKTDKTFKGLSLLETLLMLPYAQLSVHQDI